MSRGMKIILLIIASFYFVTNVYAWTFTYDRESPLGSENANTLDSAIQEAKKSTDERLNIDHYFAADNTSMNDATCGYHRKVSMPNATSVTEGKTDYGILHVEDVSSAAELHYMDESDNDVQITSGGELAYGNPAEFTNLSTTGNLTVHNNLEVDGYANIDGHLTVSESSRIGHESIAKAWVRFDGSGVTINDDFGVLSVGDDGTGLHTITWDIPFGNIYYAVVGTAGITTPGVLYVSTYTAFTNSTCVVRVSNVAGSATDSDITSVIAFGASQ